MSEEQQSNVPIEKLVKIYLKIKASKEELTKQYEQQVEDLDKEIQKIRIALLTYCKENNAESVRTKEGLFYRTIKKKYTTSDWESLHNFILEHKAPHLLAKSIHQSNMQEFLEGNPDLLPPGLSVDSEYVLTIRRK